MTPSFPFIHGKALPDYILISMSIESKPELDHPSEGSQNLNTPSAPAPKVSDQQTPLCTQAHRIAHLLHLEKTYPPSVPGIPDLGKGRWRTHHLPYLVLFLTNKKMNSSLVLAAPTLGPISLHRIQTKSQESLTEKAFGAADSRSACVVIVVPYGTNKRLFCHPVIWRNFVPFFFSGQSRF